MSYRQYTILGLRGIQILCMTFIVTGFIWASSDWLLLTVLVDAPVTPISVLLMFYGTLGSGSIEVLVRFLERKRFLSEHTETRESG